MYLKDSQIYCGPAWQCAAPAKA